MTDREFYESVIANAGVCNLNCEACRPDLCNAMVDDLLDKYKKDRYNLRVNCAKEELQELSK